MRILKAFEKIDGRVLSRVRGFLRGGFVRSVGVLAGGTALAQVISFLILPILTRLYTPSHFSVLAVYASVLGIVSVAACLGFDLAIPLPERDDDAANILALSIASFTVVSAGLAALVVFTPGLLANALHLESIRQYFWLLPIGVFVVSLYGALQMWAVRKKAFSAVARTRISQACLGGAVQLGVGYLEPSPLGLVAGHIFNSGAGVIGLGWSILSKDISAVRGVSYAGMRRMLKTYARFPRYVTFENLSNTAGSQLPIIIIAALAIGPEAGFLMLAMRAAQVPMSLLGGAVAQVYLSHAPAKLREGALANYTAEVIDGLIKVGVGPLVFLAFVAPQAFVLVFGAEWARAGLLVGWMTPWFAMQFISSPVSMVMHVMGHQRLMLGLTLFGLVLRVGCLGGAYILMPNYLSEAYALSGGIFYSVCFGIFTRTAKVTRRHLMLILKNNYRMIFVWLLLGVVAKILINACMSLWLDQ